MILPTICTTEINCRVLLDGGPLPWRFSFSVESGVKSHVGVSIFVSKAGEEGRMEATNKSCTTRLVTA